MSYLSARLAASVARSLPRTAQVSAPSWIDGNLCVKIVSAITSCGTRRKVI